MNSLFVFTDQQGCVLSVFDENGRKVFDATYDAWGRQTVRLNAIGLRRGYTGHEMMGEFGLINMNRRSLARSGESNGCLYDPTLGRFLSPDNHMLTICPSNDDLTHGGQGMQQDPHVTKRIK